jgi:hypothetical protein
MSREDFRTFYQTFGYTADANGEASLDFKMRLPTHTVSSLGELVQNPSPGFHVVVRSEKVDLLWFLSSLGQHNKDRAQEQLLDSLTHLADSESSTL